MGATDSWTSRNRLRESGDRQPAMTLGEWLDAMGAEDDERGDRGRRRAARPRHDDDPADDRILKSALAEIDARERRMERRTDDMLEALDRWMSRGDRPANGRPAEPGRLDAALDQIERRLSDIAGRIDERLAAPTPGAGHAELDARLADIGRRIDAAQAARRADPQDQERLARLESSLETLVKRLETRPGDAPAPLNGPRRRARPDIAAATAEIRAHQMKLEQAAQAPAGDLNDRLAAIAERLEAAQTRTIEAIAPAFDTMRSDIAALASRLQAPPPQQQQPDFSPLRDQLDSLKSAIVGAISDRPAVDAIRGEIASLGRRLDQPKPAVDIAPLQQQIASLATRLETPPASAQIDEEMAALRSAVVSAVRERDHLDPTRLLDGLESRIDAAGGRISNDVRSQIQVAILELRQAIEQTTPASDQSPLADEVRRLSDRLDASYARRDDGTTLARIESQLSNLSIRFDRLQAEPAAAMDGDQLERLAGEIRTMAREIGPASAVAKLEDQLQALDAKLEDVRSRPVAVSGKGASKAVAELSGLESMIRNLTERMEAAREDQNNGPARFDELQEQIRAVAEKLDRTDGAQSLSSIERTISDLFAQIDSLRQDRDSAAEMAARRAAEAAAREVADDVLRRAADIAGANPRLEALADDVSALRRTGDLVDRKTHETLEAIHSALEKIVERIGAVERDVLWGGATPTISESAPVPPAASVMASAPPAAPPLAPAPAPVAAPPAAPEPAPAATRARPVSPPQDADAPLTARLTGRRQTAVNPAVETPAGKSLFSIKLPFMGRAKPSAAAESAARPPAPNAATPAAARSANADLPLEPGSGRPAVAKPSNDAAAAMRTQLVAAARRASQLAVEETSAARAGKSASAEPEAEKGKSFLEARKKPILIGLAALVLAVLAVNVLTRTGGDIAPRTEEKVSAILPAAPADTAKRPQAAESTPAAPLDITPPPSSQVDTTVVGSIPKPGDAPPSAKPVEAPPSLIPAPAPIDASDLPTAITSPVLRDAALRGDPAAAYEVGVRLFDGRGVARDPKLALKWFERSANEGLAPAQFRVGNMYEKGVGVARDAKLAKLWYQRAADKGNAKALHNLGVLIAEGGDGKPDYAVAADHFTRAAKLGVRDSQYNIAILMARGLGVAQSMTDAYMWLSVAAQQGDDEAAKKRDEIGQRLSPAELASAKAAAQAFKPAPNDKFANDVAAPEKGWDAPIASPAPTPSRGKAKGDGSKV